MEGLNSVIYIGTSESECIFGTEGADVISGKGGSDVIFGFGGGNSPDISVFFPFSENSSHWLPNIRIIIRSKSLCMQSALEGKLFVKGSFYKVTKPVEFTYR